MRMMFKESYQMIKDKLLRIISADAAERIKLINDLQREVWDNERDSDDPELAILRDLAYDLDYYEPNEELRAEDASFYGDERLVEELTGALVRLDAIQPQ